MIDQWTVNSLKTTTNFSNLWYFKLLMTLFLETSEKYNEGKAVRQRESV